MSLRPITTTETQATITAWAVDTFGPVPILSVAARMNKEVGELLAVLVTLELAKHDGSVSSAEIVRLEHLVREEAADVKIMLDQIAERIGFLLPPAVDSKMAINRDRSWVKTPDGHFQHT